MRVPTAFLIIILFCLMRFAAMFAIPPTTHPFLESPITLLQTHEDESILPPHIENISQSWSNMTIEGDGSPHRSILIAVQGVASPAILLYSAQTDQDGHWIIRDTLSALGLGFGAYRMSAMEVDTHHQTKSPPSAVQPFSVHFSVSDIPAFYNDFIFPPAIVIAILLAILMVLRGRWKEQKKRTRTKKSKTPS